MNTTNFDELSRRIEQIVQEHITECRRVAQGAVERAFAAAIGVPPHPSSKTPPPPSARRERKAYKRRDLAEVAGLRDRLHAAVCASPGETMAALAAQLGTSASELHLPMAHLKRLGKVRHVGERNFTRYFPLEASAA